MSMLFNPLRGNGPSSIGLEEAQIAAVVQIHDHIDVCSEASVEAWDPIDQQISSEAQRATGAPCSSVPPKGCIYPGVRGGVLEMPWDRFPAHLRHGRPCHRC
jgi:hypothetical protein